MKLARKLAAGAIAAGLTTAGVAAATPASATVVNSTCNLSSVVNINVGQDCYVWDGNKATGYVGGMYIVGVYQVCSDSYTGWVTDVNGFTYNFYRNSCNYHINGAILTSITFTGN
ncbi:hypothetical protein SAMN05216223_11685 [Actinacidiphila yanglinensis]|uniref:Uncharacterized protein n=1 Tax=Actinacidiphila yanglinensis TaxID=310779 RepID=A0A1H6DK09_9ACTN|nr:hypothetical protein [Actinacidiphila yanglinensis]SEG85524.1 hypothetical protein SAMN05216223_11685 [Actinacidiphila yanglinensis]